MVDQRGKKTRRGDVGLVIINDGVKNHPPQKQGRFSKVQLLVNKKPHDYLVLNRTFQYSFTCGLHKNTIIVISITKVRIKKMGGPIINISKDQEILYIKITKYVIGLNINRKLKDNIKLLLISDISPISNNIYFLKDNIAKINRAIITGNNHIVQKGYQYGELTSPLIKKTINQTIGKNASKIKITPKSNHNLAKIFSILAFSSIYYFNQSQEFNQNCDINIFGSKKTSDYLSIKNGNHKLDKTNHQHRQPIVPVYILGNLDLVDRNGQDLEEVHELIQGRPFTQQQLLVIICSILTFLEVKTNGK